MSKFSKIISIIVFIILCFIGVLFLMAAPVDPSRASSRLIVGIVFIVFSIVFLAFAARGIEMSKFKVKNIQDAEEVYKNNGEKFLPDQIICSRCSNPIELTDYMKKQDVIYCEKCGKEIKLEKDGINW